MSLLALITISALLFIGVSWFCFREGMFDPSSMGIGFLFAIGVYAFAWFLPTFFLAALCLWLD